MKKWLVLALALLVAPSVAGAMTIQDVVRLTKGGAGDDVIMSQIEASKEVFTLTVQDILDLKQAGVSDRVITYMINSGKDRPGAVVSSDRTDSAPSDDGNPAGIDTRRYERLPGRDSDDAEDDEDDAEDGYEALNGRYHVGVGVGYDWSPYWNISLGWGYGGYYDPWYCGYWPSYWDYYSPFRCWSAYWWCPPRYYGWRDYGYPVYYGNHDGYWGDQRERHMKDGRSVYGRGGQTPPGADVATGYGRGYKGRPDAGNQPAPQRVVDRSRQINRGWRSGQNPAHGTRPANPSIGPSAPEPGREVKRERHYRLPEVRPPVAPVPAQPTPGQPPQSPPPPAPAPSYGGRGGYRGNVAPPRGNPPAVAPAPAQRQGSSTPARPAESGRTTKKS